MKPCPDTKEAYRLYATALRRLHLIALAAENAETKRERRDRVDELVRAALEVKVDERNT